jgi:DNA-directed RNA polymerase subunit beta'
MFQNKTIKQKSSIDDLDSVFIKLASPEKIRSWSRGEVKKAETMNYRTGRSERDGLFCEKIFGAEKDYECYCGKYKGIRYKGIVCEKCGVEITRAIVRRERMGHIDLCVPVSHIWYLKNMPSRIATILGMNTADVEKVVYFAGYLVTKVDDKEKAKLHKELDDEFKSKMKNIVDEKTKEALHDLMVTTKQEIDLIQIGRVLDENQYHKFSYKFGAAFEAMIGGEAIYNILKGLDLDHLYTKLNADLEKAGAAEREKIIRRLGFINGMRKAGVRPEWAFIKALPVIPAALRPMVALDGGRQATSDVNDLYRRVINRNNRLKKLHEIKAPDVILRNEKRILQEAVDALLDNSMKGNGAAFSGINPAQKRPLKSIADNLKGKRGLFRQNLLGKRVDYSGRSVIVVGPNLKLNECGLPKHMALELFKPFVIGEILKRELAFNIRGASRMIEEQSEEVWAILEKVIAGKYVLLNRAPTLHRLSVQAFQPILIEGNAIQVHPLVCSPFNADFDGDAMAVHVPLSEEAQYEARTIMASSRNVLKPGTGDATVTNKMLDIVLGSFWATKVVSEEIGANKYFESPEATITALDHGVIGYRAPIKVLAPTGTKKYAEFDGKLFDTTVGRILFNQLLPESYPYINKEVNKNVMNSLIDELILIEGKDNVAPLIDAIKQFGFDFATKSGITWSMSDIVIPETKYAVLDAAQNTSDKIMEAYQQGLLSEEEKHMKIVRLWQGAQADIEKLIPATLEKDGSVNDMVLSGARGSLGNINQMVGMKGLIATAQGSTIELPIRSSFKEGLTPIEYFISTHGARKGMTDTALNTAKAGYLTRKLFVLAQSVMVTETDCKTKEFITMTKATASGIQTNFSKNLFSRTVAKDLENKDGVVLFKKGHIITKADAVVIEKAGIESVEVRSPLGCKTHRGVCSMCYGADLSTGAMIDLGESVGTIAAQAIGEPGTQLTMRTFHAGGVATAAGDITAGLPRVEELFENRTPKNAAAVASTDGMVTAVIEKGHEKIIKVLSDIPAKNAKKGSEIEYAFHPARIAHVKVGQHVSRGQIMTDGSADVDELYEYAGKDAAQAYIISEVKKIYELQGDNLSRKHIEIIVREMFNRVKVTSKGDSAFSEGDIVESFEFLMANEKLEEAGTIHAKGKHVIMGTMEGSLNRQSFLAAASFQNVNRILVNASLKGNHDPLYGIMENTLIGRLIPAGTGFKGSQKNLAIEELQAEIEAGYQERI